MTTPTDQAAFIASLQSKSHGHGLRGDYSGCDAHYVVEQDWAQQYTPAQHALWRRLYARQARLLPGRASAIFCASLQKMEAADGIPQLARTSDALRKATGWELVAVPGLIPEQAFFEHLANRRFPVTVWLREEHEFDYIVEPDIFHDFFGHVPLLFNPVFSDYMQRYGQGGLKALHCGALEQLARLYWYTVEFGLINSPAGLRVYGAGILSSGGEIEHSLHAPAPKRIALRVARAMRTRYKIDSFQETYFVIENFEQLFAMTEPDFAPLYAAIAALPEIDAGVVLADEVVLPALR